MSLKNLDNLVQRGLLQKEPAHKDEVGRLLSAADATLAGSKVQGVSVASRFAMAYQAALGYSLIALRARGYRTSSHQPGQHSIAIQSLPLTVLFPQSDTHTLDSFKENVTAVPMKECSPPARRKWRKSKRSPQSCESPFCSG